jgi:putative transposase
MAEQIAFVLKQAEGGVAVAEVCRKAGISDATFYNGRKKYAGLMPSQMRRLRQLEGENREGFWQGTGRPRCIQIEKISIIIIDTQSPVTSPETIGPDPQITIPASGF